MTRFLLALALCVSLSACRRRETEQPWTVASSDVATDLANGMHLVTGILDTWAAAKTSTPGKRVVVDNHVYDPPSERGAPRYVVIDTTQHVPFIFESAPTAVEDSTGRTVPGIALDPKYTQKLKEFMSQHLGKSVAIIVDGELVSVHKIRAVIAEGKMQITSCGADVCKVLHSKLVGKD